MEHLWETATPATDTFDPGSVAGLHAHAEDSELSLQIDEAGAIRSVHLPRRGKVDPNPYAYRPFGGLAWEDGAFGGVTLPTRYGIGWEFGTDRFESEGEFFRCTLSTVVYR